MLCRGSIWLTYSVPPRAKGKRSRDIAKPLSGLDVDSLLSTREKRQKISKENAIPEFRQILESAEDFKTIEDASKQISNIIRSLITHSVGDSGYARAIETLGVMRDELFALEEPKLYNDFISDLKKRLLAGDLGGDRRDFMWEIRKGKLGLIGQDKLDISDVTPAVALEVSLRIF
jgi:ATP-dependent DNA helicase 2 subunit 2